MPLHKNLSGLELHYPLGRSSEGALQLEDDLANAYQIALGVDNQLNISTINSTEEITLGNAVQNPKLLQAGSGDVGLGTTTPSSPNGNAKAVQITGPSVGLVLDSTNGAGVPWEIQHNSSDLKVIYDGANTLGGGAKTAIALDAAGTMRLGAEVATPSAPASGDGGFVYVKSDGKLYFISDSTAETDLTAGGGGVANPMTSDLDAGGYYVTFDHETGVKDEAGNEALLFAKTTSAVNHFAMINAAAGGNATAATSTAPIIRSIGTTANVDMALEAQGTGTVTLRSRNSNAASGVLSINNEADTFAVNITVPLADDLGADYTLTLPLDDGDAGQVMQSNGSGVLSWVTPGSTLTYENKTATFSAAVDYFYTVDSSGGDVTVNLPAVASSAGKTIDVCHKVIGNDIIFDGNAAETINGATTLTVGGTAYQNITLFCTGSEWLVR